MTTWQSYTLTLENRDSFKGLAPSWQSGTYQGEIVFNTGMTGYCETLTDPSYCQQFLTFTYPLIGNYGISLQKQWESEKIQVLGVILSQASENCSQNQGICSFLEWLEENQTPLLSQIDTRALTKVLREHGTMRAIIHPTDSPPQFPLKKTIISPIFQVTPLQPSIEQEKGKKQLILVDCGMKQSILRHFSQYPISIKRVPYNYDFSEDPFDAVCFSNGPGDPKQCAETIEIAKKILFCKKPVLGICLGAQMLALAAGANTYKLKYGHRGQNQPCIEVDSKKCYLTSQNHGYAIKDQSLPNDWKVNFRNLNDGSVEGISHKLYPYSAVQFHPEAAPGPTDTTWILENFVKSWI